MKKLISIALVVFMLLSTVATSAFAKDYELDETAAAPTIDGVISDGEYTGTTGRLDTKATTEDVLYVPHNYTTTCDGHMVQYYWSYDADYVYLAYEGEGDMNTQLRFYLNPNVESGARDTIRLIMPVSWGALDETSVQVYTADSEYTSATWTDYVEECAAGNWDTGSLNVNVVEVKIKRSALNDTDVLGVRGFTEHEGGNAGEIYWGANPETSVIPYQDIWFYNAAGFHELYLGTTPAIDLPDSAFDLGDFGQQTITLEAKTVTVDGTINADEYGYSYEAVLANDASDDTFFVNGAEHLTDVTSVTFNVSYDDEYIYIGVAQDDPNFVEWSEAVYFNIGATTADKYVQIYLPHVSNNAEVLTKDASEAHTDYYNEYRSARVGTVTMDEISVSRAKLAEALGVDTLDRILLSFGQKADNAGGYVIWGFQSAALSNAGLMGQDWPTYCYPNVVNLGEPSGDQPGGDSSDGAYNLGAYGQLTFGLGEASTATVDGTVADGEYAWTLGGLGTNGIFKVGEGSDISDVKFYAGYDAEYIYLAVVTTDATDGGWGDSTNFYIGTSDATDEYVRVYMPRVDASPEMWRWDDGAVAENLTGSVATYVTEWGFTAGTTYTHEFKVSRAAVGAADLDKILLVLEARSGDEKAILGVDGATAIEGFAPVLSDASNFKAYPHVAVFGDAGAEPVDPSIIDLSAGIATAPVADGIISAGEYTYSHGTLLNAETGDNLWEAIDDKGAIISVDFPYTGGFRSVEWKLAADEEYVYVAMIANKESGSAPMAQFQFTTTKSGPQYPMATLDAAGDATNGNFASTGVGNDGQTYVYEAQFDRAFFGEATEIYFLSRAFAASPECFLMFGIGAESMTVLLPEIQGEEPEGPEVPGPGEDDECDHSVDPGKSTLSYHYCECGEFYDIHQYGKERVVLEATCTQPGRTVKTCIICGYAFYKSTEVDSDAHTFVNGVCACGATETVDTVAPETQAPVTQAPETQAPETQAPVTQAPETQAPETQAPEAEGGCGASVAAIAVALVAALGTCTVFVSKKRD